MLLVYDPARPARSVDWESRRLCVIVSSCELEAVEKD